MLGPPVIVLGAALPPIRAGPVTHPSRFWHQPRPAGTPTRANPIIRQIWPRVLSAMGSVRGPPVQEQRRKHVTPQRPQRLGALLLASCDDLGSMARMRAFKRQSLSHIMRRARCRPERRNASEGAAQAPDFHTSGAVPAHVGGTCLFATHGPSELQERPRCAPSPISEHERPRNPNTLDAKNPRDHPCAEALRKTLMGRHEPIQHAVVGVMSRPWAGAPLGKMGRHHYPNMSRRIVLCCLPFFAPQVARIVLARNSGQGSHPTLLQSARKSGIWRRCSADVWNCRPSASQAIKNAVVWP